MNAKLYMLACLKDTYEQYPRDSAQSVFGEMIRHHIKNPQLHISRQGCMMFYVYIHPLTPKRCLFWKRKRFFGLGMQINGMALNDLSAIIREFENAMNLAVTSGILLAYDEFEQITPSANSLSKDQEEVERVLGHLAKNGHLDRSAFVIPQQSFNIAADSVAFFTDKDPFDHIVKASTDYGYTIVDLIADKESKQKNAKRFQELVELSKHIPDILSQTSKKKWYE